MSKVPIRGLLIIYLIYINIIVWGNMMSVIISFYILNSEGGIKNPSEFILSAILLLVYILISFLFFKRNSFLPKLSIFLESFIFLINGTELLLSQNSLISKVDLISLSLVNCLWIVYFLKSNRVKITFIK
jgi:hypothetical protein